MNRLRAEPAALARTAVDPETGHRYRCRASRPVLLLTAVPLLLVAVLLPLVVTTRAVAVVGVLAFPFLLVGLASLLLRASGGFALDGTVVTTRHLWGTATFDLTCLQSVHGQQVRGRHGKLESLQLRDVDDRPLEVTSSPGFPPGRSLRKTTAHLVHRQVRASVLAGAVPRVSRGGCAVLGAPDSCARGRVEGRAAGALRALLFLLGLLLAAYGWSFHLLPLYEGLPQTPP